MKKIVLALAGLFFSFSAFAANENIQCSLGKSKYLVELVQPSEKSACDIKWKGEVKYHVQHQLELCQKYKNEMVSKLEKVGYKCEVSAPVKTPEASEAPKTSPEATKTVEAPKTTVEAAKPTETKMEAPKAVQPSETTAPASTPVLPTTK